MKIRKKDSIKFTKENALEEAKKALEKTNYFAVIYGKRLNGQDEYFKPILVDERALNSFTNKITNADENGLVYALYQGHMRDAPLYEIEYDKGQAFIDIPDNEIEEFVKKYLKEILENPRLFGKYKKEFEDLFEKELENYANEQFYKKGRGEILEDSDEEEFVDNTYDVELEYDDLEITVWHLVSRETRYEPAEYDDAEVEISYTYEVEGTRIVEYFLDNAKYFKELKDIEDEDELEKYIRKNFDDLVENHYRELKEEYRKEASEEAEENYDPSDYDYDDSDYYDDDITYDYEKE